MRQTISRQTPYFMVSGFIIIIFIIIIIIIIIIELTHREIISENSLKFKPQPAVLDFENLS